MIKKINFILVLLLLLVSISAVTAADDLNDTIARVKVYELEQLLALTKQKMLSSSSIEEQIVYLKKCKK